MQVIDSLVKPTVTCIKIELRKPLIRFNLSDFSHLGIQRHKSDFDHKKAAFSNLMNYIMMGLMAIVILVSNITDYFTEPVYQFQFGTGGLMFLACTFHLILNALGKWKLTRMVMVLDAPLILLLFNAMDHGVIAEHYFWFPYALTAFSVGSYYLFRDARDKNWLITILTIYFLMIFFMDNILNLLATEEIPVQSIVQENIVFYKLAPLLIYLFVNTTMYTFVKMTGRYQVSLKNSRKELNTKNRELADKNSTLENINRTKDKFFSIIGHDLRNLTGLSMQVADTLSKKSSISAEEKEELIRILQENTHKEFKLLQNLLEWAKAQSGDIGVTNSELSLKCLVSETMELLDENARMKQIDLNNNIPNEVTFAGDANMMKTVMRNLVSNAIKFTPDKGVVNINYTADDTHQFIEVQDTGMGIPEDTLKKLFELDGDHVRMGTHGEKGSGLGLQLCLEFIKMHQGTIDVKSIPGKGSSFTINLPKQLPEN